MDSDEELTLLRRRVAELELSAARYRDIFEGSPVSLWEEDWTAVKEHTDRLVAAGVDDFEAHFRDHFNEVVTCIGLVKILDVNQATLDLCRAATKEQLFAGMGAVFDAATLDAFRRELVAVIGGAMSYEEESVLRTLDGEQRNVMIRLTVGQEHARTWKRCFVSITDITELKRAEEALRRSREETIHAQRDLLAQLSTPVIPISDEILVMPFVGALDRARLQQTLVGLLEAVQRSRARAVILDITGVPELDEEAANGLVQAAQAVRLLGAQAMLTGIRPEVARRLVTLGASLAAIETHATMQAGIVQAMQGAAPRR